LARLFSAQEGKREVDPDFGNIVPSDPSKGSCTLTALVDDKGTVCVQRLLPAVCFCDEFQRELAAFFRCNNLNMYALRGDISVSHNGKTLLKASRHMLIDYDRFSSS